MILSYFKNKPITLIMALVYFTVLSGCGPKRLGCGPSRCEKEKQEKPTNITFLKNNFSKMA
jgi:hypothetical protein